MTLARNQTIKKTVIQAYVECGDRKSLRHWNLSGEGGIRTLGTCDSTQHFQCCTFGLSVTSPSSSKPRPKNFCQKLVPANSRR